ncbi:MAG: DUF2058 domain-containing protein [Thiomicrorhabdus sp.]|nr:DUF2058 domain-containing protein [Thiomicrorhabdus sp.]
MAGSLFDQLKKSGLVNDKKAKQIQREKQQQSKKSRANKSKKGQTVASEAAQLAAKAAQEKAEHDKQLNIQRQQQQAQKAKQAELLQIIEANQLKDYQGDIAYNFADGVQVKTLNVSAKVQKQLSSEALCIARFKGGYALISAEAAEKVKQRDETVLIIAKSHDESMSEEDKAYYARFEVPDDLIW